MPQRPAEMGAGATQTIELPPHAQLVIPRFSVEEVCAVFGQFLRREGFTCSAAVLNKELEVHRQTSGDHHVEAASRERG